MKRWIMIGGFAFALAASCGQAVADESSRVDTLKTLGYDKLPGFLNTLAKKKQFRMPTEFECKQYAVMPTQPVSKNAYVAYLNVAYGVDWKNAPPGSASAIDFYDGDFKRFSEWILKHKALMADIKKAESLPAFESPIISLVEEDPLSISELQRGDTLFPTRFRMVGRFFVDVGFYYETKGETDLALEYYLKSIRLGKRMVDLESSTIFSLVGKALIAMGRQPVDSLVGRQRLTDEQLQLVAKEAQAIGPLWPKVRKIFLAETRHHWKLSLDKAYAGEWIAYVEPKLKKALEEEKARLKKEGDPKDVVEGALRDIDQIRTDAAMAKLVAVKKTFAMTDENRKAVAELMERTLIPELDAWLKLGPIEADEVVEKKLTAVKEGLEKLLPEAADEGWERFASGTSIAKAVTRLEELLPRPKLRDFAVRSLWTMMTYPLLGSLRRGCYGQTVRNDCLSLRVAMERYRLRHKRYPTKLADMVPQFIAKLPMDPHSGKSYLYKTEGKSWRIYSVGPDQTDDGGWTVRLGYGSRAKDIGILSFVPSNTDYRKNIDEAMYEVQQNLGDKKAIKGIIDSYGLVYYRGEWIRKKEAQDRHKRDTQRQKSQTR